jgi:pimeloyl-ACP methyl ester carboxylesterase
MYLGARVGNHASACKKLTQNRRMKQLVVVLMLACMTMSFAKAESVEFRNGEDLLSGHYLQPDSGKPKAVILFVHGDGPLDYDSHGYYPLIWKRLLKQGFAIFSWDKPGVGSSTGNWLAQSMQDRQQEVQSAINVIRKRYGFSGTQVGLLGFSQAGWVVPALAKNNPDIGFIIGIGFAIDWLEQSWYLTHVRLKQQGANETVIQAAYATHIQEIEFLEQKSSYDLYLKKYGLTPKQMSEDRYGFILKNSSVNATQDYIGLKQPMLLLLGDKDLNVDVDNTKSVVEKLIDGQQNIQITIIKNATHGMLDAKHFNQQSPGLTLLFKLIWKGDKALAPEFNHVLDEWLSRQSLLFPN